MHKAPEGFIDLVFENTGTEALTQKLSTPQLPLNAKVVRTGKSASLRLWVTPIKNFANSADGNLLSDPFNAISRLFEFYRNNHINLADDHNS